MSDLPSWIPLPPDERLTRDPARLCRIDRLTVLRFLAGKLGASPWAAERWLGGALARIAEGEPAETVLGLATPRGGRRSVARLARLHRRDKALLDLRAACQTDEHALQVLRGQAPCPPGAERLVAAAKHAGCPTGVNALSTARRRFTAWTTLNRE